MDRLDIRILGLSFFLSVNRGFPSRGGEVASIPAIFITRKRGKNPVVFVLISVENREGSNSCKAR